MLIDRPLIRSSSAHSATVKVRELDTPTPDAFEHCLSEIGIAVNGDIALRSSIKPSIGFPSTTAFGSCYPNVAGTGTHHVSRVSRSAVNRPCQDRRRVERSSIGDTHSRPGSGTSRLLRARGRQYNKSVDAATRYSEIVVGAPVGERATLGHGHVPYTAGHAVQAPDGERRSIFAHGGVGVPQRRAVHLPRVEIERFDGRMEYWGHRDRLDLRARHFLPRAPGAPNDSVVRANRRSTRFTH